MNLKIIKKKINFNGTSQEKFTAKIERADDVTTDELVQEIKEATSLTNSDITAVIIALQEHIQEHVAKGAAVQVGTLGKFVPSIRAKAEATKDEVSVNSIREVKCLFQPTVKFKKRLKDVNFVFKNEE